MNHCLTSSVKFMTKPPTENKVKKQFTEHACTSVTLECVCCGSHKNNVMFMHEF